LLHDSIKEKENKSTITQLRGGESTSQEIVQFASTEQKQVKKVVKKRKKTAADASQKSEDLKAQFPSMQFRSRTNVLADVFANLDARRINLIEKAGFTHLLRLPQIDIPK